MLKMIRKMHLDQPPKTKNSYRKVTIDRFLIQELKQYQLLKKKYKFMLGREYSKFNFAFCKKNGDRLRARTIQTAFDCIKLRAGVPNIKIHDLHHTHAVMCLEAGMTLKEIQELLWHKDIMTTDIY